MPVWLCFTSRSPFCWTNRWSLNATMVSGSWMVVWHGEARLLHLLPSSRNVTFATKYQKVSTVGSGWPSISVGFSINFYQFLWFLHVFTRLNLVSRSFSIVPEMVDSCWTQRTKTSGNRRRTRRVIALAMPKSCGAADNAEDLRIYYEHIQTYSYEISHCVWWFP
jgi:hypothetical protein